MDRSRASYAVLALLVAASLAMTVWVVGARHELDQVEAHWAGAPACTGATVKPYRDGWMIGARPAMSCRITLAVTNRSGRDVLVDSVVAPGLGSMAGGTAVALTKADTNPDGLDAELPVDRVLPDGRTVKVALEIGFRDGACGGDDAGGLLSVAHWPEVGLSLWQRTALVPADRTLYVRDASGSSCP
ncbi:hypothetical protein [Nocardioides sp. LS1]|uniref:hypothetical protein n=1 Tax=Nocardioides sp. LS1 TaxID=1027620 RepID=UPI000F61D23E|nr:hypothetical protein [Nocardioides sp. LS1]GCD90273.1 hypothetical protein NLS1_22790 [Nocardioides sp. LS1]